MARILGRGSFPELAARTVIAPQPGRSGVAPGHGATPPGHGGIPPGHVSVFPATGDVGTLSAFVVLAQSGTPIPPPPPTAVPVKFIQAVVANGHDGGSTTQLTMPTMTIAAGNTVIFATAINPSTVNITSIADGLGNTYTAIGAGTTGADGVKMQLYYAKNVTGGACTIVVTTNTNMSGFCAWAAHEVQGLNTVTPLDQNRYNSGNTSGVDAATSLAVTPTTSGQYIFGFCEADGVTPSAGTGYTSRTVTAQTSLILGERSEDLIQSSAAAIAATFTLGVASQYVAAVATFKA